MKKFSKPTTGAFVLSPAKAKMFLESKKKTSDDVLARFERLHTEKIKARDGKR